MAVKLGKASQMAVDILKSQGIEMWPEQTSQVVLPKDISSVDSEVLSDLFTRLTAWSDYVNTQLSAALIDEKAAEKALDLAQNKMLVARMGAGVKGERITVVKAEIATDQTIIALDKVLFEAYAYRKMVETVVNNLDRDITLISREITRRSNDSRSFRKDRFSL